MIFPAITFKCPHANHHIIYKFKAFVILGRVFHLKAPGRFPVVDLDAYHDDPNTEDDGRVDPRALQANDYVGDDVDNRA